MKEKAKVAPKELVHRGADSGLERMRGQLREAAQQGDTADDFGADKIDDTAVEAARRTERGAEDAVSRYKAKVKERQYSRSGDTPPADGPTAPEQPSRPDTPVREASEHPIKTKDAYIQGQEPAPSKPAGNPQNHATEQGRRAAVDRNQTRRELRRQNAPESRPISRRTTGLGSSAPTNTPTTARPGGAGIRESGRSAERSVKTTAKGTVKATQKSVKTAEHTSHAAIKTSQHTAKAAQKTAQATVKASQRAVQAARATAKAAATSAKATAKAVSATVKAIIAAVKGLIAAIAAGGWVAVLIILVICMLGLIVGSCFGIFFSGESTDGGMTMPEAITQLNTDFSAEIDGIIADNPHDTLDIQNNGSAALVSNWDDVLAVYSVKVTTDAENPMVVATMDDAKLELLRSVFWDMNQISYTLETISGEAEEESTVILHITVTSKTYLQMADAYGFTAEQREQLDELMKPEYAELFMALTGSYKRLQLSAEEIRAIMENLPQNLSAERKAVVLTAYSLLDKVSYFWGGKSLVIGWDSRWGTPATVWAEGSSTTGTVRPYGLDCSGFADWVFYNAYDGEYIIGHGGGAAAQYDYCDPIDWDNAQPGDLAFYPDCEHVGVVVANDGSGTLTVVHCASGYNNVVVTQHRLGDSTFTFCGRPQVYAE